MPPADAPWEKGQNASARAKRTQSSAVDKDQRKKIVLIVVVVVAAIVVFSALNYMFSSPEEEAPVKPLTTAEEESVQNERREAELQIHAVIAQLRADKQTGAADEMIMAGMEQQFKEGKYVTAHYRVAQATLTRRKGPSVPDVVVVCYPTDAATNPRSSGYAEFRWDNNAVNIEWR